MLNRLPRILRSAAGDGNPGATPAAPAAAAAVPSPPAPVAGAPAAPPPAAPPPAAAAPSPPAAGAPAAYRPNGMPDHYAGKSDNETIDKMWNALDGFIRTKDSRGPAVEAADKYAFSPPDALKDRVGDLSKDPYFAAMRDAAYATKMTQPEFQSFMGTVLDKVAAMAETLPPPDFESNAQVVQGNRDWAKNMQSQGRLTADEVAELDALALSKAGSSLIAKLQAQMSPGYVAQPSPAPGHGGQYGDAPQTIEQANKLVADPRFATDSAKYDAGFRKWADGEIMRLRLARPAA